ncbi:MAG TPA: flavin reductase family protein [Baekduia sp.]|jgi:flavin reductase (DIM6/NTAB) family NADH-FMN oxidoreductase RutF
MSSTLTGEEFRTIVGHFVSGVTVVTAVHDGRRFGTTASAFSSLSLDPPMVVTCLNRSSETGEAICGAGRFAVNVLGEDQGELALRFGRKGGDKFRSVEVVGGAGGVPLLVGALATFECRVIKQTVGGTHRVFLAEVDHAVARADGTPLAYFRGRFGRLEAGG